MADIIRIDDQGLQPFDKLTPAQKRNMTLEQKKSYMLQKYGKQKFNINDIRQYGVFLKPYDADRFSWELVGRAETVEQCEEMILWRFEFHHGNKDGAFANDPRLRTFEDETLPGGGKTLSHYTNMVMDYRGEYTIMPLYHIEELENK